MGKRQFGPPRTESYTAPQGDGKSTGKTGQPSEDEIGICWAKDGKKGRFYSGFLRWEKLAEMLAEAGFTVTAPDKPDDKIDDLALIIFDTGNDRKNPKAPDLRIMKAKPRD